MKSVRIPAATAHYVPGRSRTQAAQAAPTQLRRSVSPGAAGSRYAAALFSDRIVAWANLTSSPSSGALDLSDYVGLRFRARGQSKLRALLLDQHMIAENDWDGFGLDFVVQDDWRDYVLLFDDPRFIQRYRWGRSFDRRAVSAIQFMPVGDPLAPDFAVDDVELLRRPALARCRTTD